MLLASAATAAAVALAGCDTTDSPLTKSSLRAKQPLSDKLLAEMDKKDMTKETPILVRIFKEESELEVWKKNSEGRYALLKTYPICRWSGELGPKVKLGDRQAPEGFYNITPGQMNPNSSYYLAFNTGFPNAYDRAWSRSGSDLMVHGDCSSRGCYAMTDEQIGEIYALAREAFFGGQRSFQLQAYPFRMTPLNMARHRNNPNMAFWKMLKEGYDHFEVSHLEPKVNVCDRHYVFDAEKPANASQAISFSPTGKCPVYEVPPDIATAVAEKQQHDAARVAELVSRGTPAAPIRTGTDGGMNPVFMAALNEHQQTFAARGDVTGATRTSSGTIPATVNPPQITHAVYAYDSPDLSSPALASPRVAAKPTTGSSGGLFDRMARVMGLQRPAQEPKPLVGTASKPAPKRPTAVASRTEPKPHVEAPAKPPAATGPHVEAPAKLAPAASHAAPLPKPDLRGTGTAAATPAPAAQGTSAKSASAAQSAPPATATAMMAPSNAIHGAQPVVAAGSFESRWLGVR
jgi:murein L,D-transpeptidase YafK